MNILIIILRELIFIGYFNMENLPAEVITLIEEINTYQSLGLITHVSYRLARLAKLCIKINNVTPFNLVTENRATEIFKNVAQVMLEKLSVIPQAQSEFSSIFELLQRYKDRENLENFSQLEKEFLSAWFAVENTIDD